MLANMNSQQLEMLDLNEILMTDFLSSSHNDSKMVFNFNDDDGGALLGQDSIRVGLEGGLVGGKM